MISSSSALVASVLNNKFSINESNSNPDETPNSPDYLHSVHSVVVK